MTNRTRIYALLGLACVGIWVAPAVLAVGPEDAEEWADKGAIEVCIMSPAANTYVPIITHSP